MLSRYIQRTFALGGLLTSLLTPLQHLAAQSLDSLPTGARVRLNLSLSFAEARKQAPTMLVGSLLSASADTVVIDLGAGHATVRVQRTAVRAAWMSLGASSRWRAAVRSAVRPAIAGAAFGAVGASINRREGDPSVASAAVLNGAFGAVLAGVRAAWVRSDRWRSVSIAATPCRAEASPCAR